MGYTRQTAVLSYAMALEIKLASGTVARLMLEVNPLRSVHLRCRCFRWPAQAAGIIEMCLPPSSLRLTLMLREFALTTHSGGQFFDPFNGERWVSQRFQGDGHEFHGIIIGGAAIGA